MAKTHNTKLKRVDKMDLSLEFSDHLSMSQDFKNLVKSISKKENKIMVKPQLPNNKTKLSNNGLLIRMPNEIGFMLIGARKN